MEKTILTVTLNPAVDKIVKIPGFEVGKDFHEEGITLSAGGKGINVSRVLKELKVKTLTTGIIGGAGGRYIKRQLGREKIRYDFCEIHSETRTNLTILDPSSGKSTRLLDRGPQIGGSDVKRFEKKLNALFTNVEYVVFSGSLMPGMNDSFYARLIQEAQKRNIKTVLDTSDAPLREGSTAGPYLLKPNLQEAEFLWGRKIGSFAEAKQAAMDFLSKGVQVVIITMGDRGALGVKGPKALLASTPKVAVESTVGCGDALLAGFLFSEYHQRDFAESLQIGMATAAANCLNPQPGAIDSQALQELVDKVELKEI